MQLTLENLLPLWAQKQPGRLTQIEGNSDLWHICSDRSLPIVNAANPSRIGYAATEYAVREAIAELGWSWEKIAAPDFMVVRRGKVPHCQPTDECGGIEAIAILAALLKALGAEIGGDEA